MFSYGKFLLLLGYFILVSSKDLPTTSSPIPIPAETFQCPMDMCRCGLDPRGRVKVVCDRGDMVDPIPIRAMDPLTEVLFISSPEEKSNSLTIGPIFQVIYSQMIFFTRQSLRSNRILFEFTIGGRFIAESYKIGGAENCQLFHPGYWQTLLLGFKILENA